MIIEIFSSSVPSSSMWQVDDFRTEYLPTRVYLSLAQCNSNRDLLVDWIFYRHHRHNPPTPKQRRNGIAIPNIEVWSYSRRQRIVHVPRDPHFPPSFLKNSVARESVELPPPSHDLNILILGRGTCYRIWIWRQIVSMHR